MAEAASRIDRIEAPQGANDDACDPQVAPCGSGILVTIYGRPFQLTEHAARALAWGLVSAIEEMDRNRRC